MSMNKKLTIRKKKEESKSQFLLFPVVNYGDPDMHAKI